MAQEYLYFLLNNASNTFCWHENQTNYAIFTQTVKEQREVIANAIRSSEGINITPVKEKRCQW